MTDELGGLRDPETADWLRDVDPAIEAELRKHAKRISEQVDRGWGTPSLMQKLAKEIRLGDDWSSAVLRVLERAKTAPGVYVEPGMVENVDRKTCHVTGEVVQLWDPGHPKIDQVGLLAGKDGSTVKFTAWTKSRCNEVEEGDHVVMKDVVRNWYQGRVSIALTWDSHVQFLDDEDGDGS